MFEQDLTWPVQDGPDVTLSLDFSAGFPPGVSSLYDVDQHILALTGKLSFTYSGVPLKVVAMPDNQPDFWFSPGWAGF